MPSLPVRTVSALSLALLASALPLVATALGWHWYLDGPLVVGSIAAGFVAGVVLPRGVAPVVVVVLAIAGTVANQLDNDEYHWLDDAVFFAVIAGLPMIAGAAVSARARQVRELARLRAEVDEQHRIEVATARLEEQNRIQRDAHSVLAERIGAIALRAEGAQRSEDPDALAAIETESREVLDRLRGVLGSMAPSVTDEACAIARDSEDARSPLRPGRDLVVALALGAAIAVEILVIDRARGPAWANVIAAFAVALPLAWQRVAALRAVVTAGLMAVAMSAWLTPLTVTVTGVAWLLLLFYAVGAWCRGWRLPVGFAVAILATVAAEHVSGLTSDSDPGDGGWIVVLFAVGAAGLGRLTAGWGNRVRAIGDAVTTLQRGRDAELRLAEAEEREALSRSLHDTVAHAMTVVCVQAAAAQRNGSAAGGALRTIASTAASSLAELREGLEEADSNSDPLAPSRITALGRRLGVDVGVRRSGDHPTTGAARLAYRVVREAVVNVARHAPGAAATVTITASDDVLDVEITDDGGASEKFVHGSGRGLAGLADAVGHARGALTWGPLAGGGFRVAATIPEAAR